MTHASLLIHLLLVDLHVTLEKISVYLDSPKTVKLQGDFAVVEIERIGVKQVFNLVNATGYPFLLHRVDVGESLLDQPCQLGFVLILAMLLADRLKLLLGL